MKDSFGREITYLRLSVTELCSLRCRYCMPEEGICRKAREEMLTEEEMVTAVRAAASLGIRKLRITGGEPLVKKNILSIVEHTAAVPGIREVCMTTNGIRLSEMAADLKKAGLDRINISLDTLNEEKYAYITRRGKLSDVLSGIEAALSAGFSKVKLNAVLIGGFNDDEIRPLASLTLKYPLDVRFIELMPMIESSDFSTEAFLPYSRVLEELPEATACPSDDGVAKLYELPEAKGKIGLISPVSSHFCGTCSRLRLTADGRIKPCLHGREEFPIKGLTESEMKEQFQKAILAKPEWHGALGFKDRSQAGRSMNEIGG